MTRIVKDGYLRKNLDTAKDIVKKNWDMVFIIDGYEGSGKSVMAQQCAKYVDPTFNIDRIVFSPEECRKVIATAKPRQAIIYDEAYGGLNALRANHELIQTLTECRRRNLFLFIVLPSFFDLKKYVAIHRGIGLIHVYSVNFKRGFFRFYNRERKKDLYVLGKKFYNYNVVKSNFYGDFGPGWHVDEKAYDDKKYQATMLAQKEGVGIASQKDKASRNAMILHLLHKGYSQREIASIAGISKTTVQSVWSDGKNTIITPNGVLPMPEQ